MSGRDFSIIDEIYQHAPFNRIFFGTNPVVQSKVRIRFNRPLTWSEREHFRRFVNAEQIQKHHFNHEDPSELFITTNQGSRVIVEKVSAFVASEYLNIHPKAVKTITPKVEV